MGLTPISSPLTALLREASLVAGPGAGCHPRLREKRPSPHPRLVCPGPPPYAPCILADSELCASTVTDHNGRDQEPLYGSSEFCEPS